MKVSQYLASFLVVICFLFIQNFASAQNGSINLESTTDAPFAKTVYGNSMPLAYGTIDQGGNILTGYGIASVTLSAAGSYEIVLSNGFAGHAVVNITQRLPFINGVDRNITYESAAATSTIYAFFGNDLGQGVNTAFSFVVYGTPLNYGSDCPIVMSGTGVGQAPNENLHFNFTDGADCLDAIPFAITDPTPAIQVVVGDFVSPPATDPVEVTINHDFGAGVLSQSINLTATGATINLGTYVSPSNFVPYDIDLILTYDGTQFATAQVVATPQ